MGRLNPSRETKFSGTYGDRGILIFPVQLTMSRITNLTRLIHTLLYVMTIHTYIHKHIHIPMLPHQGFEAVHVDPHAVGAAAAVARGAALLDPAVYGKVR